MSPLVVPVSGQRTFSKLESERRRPHTSTVLLGWPLPPLLRSRAWLGAPLRAAPPLPAAEPWRRPCRAWRLEQGSLREQPSGPPPEPAPPAPLAPLLRCPPPWLRSWQGASRGNRLCTWTGPTQLRTLR